MAPVQLALAIVALLSGAAGGLADFQTLADQLEQTISSRMSADGVAEAVVW